MSMYVGKWPGEVDSVDRPARTVRVRIPGVTDGATVFPEAQICYPIGDKSEHTEIRVKAGDRVWVEFERADARYPIIVGFRPKNRENGVDWRRFEHANFDFQADAKFVIHAGDNVEINAGNNATVNTQNVEVNAQNSHFTGAVTIDGLLTFKGGLAGSGGSGGVVGSITGGDLKVDGVGVKSHRHVEQGDGQLVGPAAG
jgi:hypothetical protein